MYSNTQASVTSIVLQCILCFLHEAGRRGCRIKDFKMYHQPWFWQHFYILYLYLSKLRVKETIVPDVNPRLWRKYTYSSTPPPEIVCAPYCSPPARSHIVQHVDTHARLTSMCYHFPSRCVWWTKGPVQRERSPWIRSLGAKWTQTSTYAVEWWCTCICVWKICVCDMWLCACSSVCVCVFPKDQTTCLHQFTEWKWSLIVLSTVHTRPTHQTLTLITSCRLLGLSAPIR